MRKLVARIWASPWPRRVAAAAVVTWALVITALAAHPRRAPAARGLSSGGGMVFGAGGALSKVTTNSAGLLAGSGTVSNPLTATLSVTGIVSGTGSSGSPLTATEVGDISGVTAGSGLLGGGTSDGVTLAVGAGSGILASGSTVAVDTGTGITISSNHVTLAQTAATCANGQAITTTTATGGETCGDTTENSYFGLHKEWINEWLGDQAVAANGYAPGPGGYACGAAGGTCTGPAATNYAQNHPGVYELTATTATTGRAGFFVGTTTVDYRVGSWSFEWVGGWETLSSATDAYVSNVGFIDTKSAIDQVDGCYFIYDERNAVAGGQNGSNLQRLECACSSNSTRTIYLLNGSGNSDESFALGTVTVAALAAPDTNFLHLKVIMTGTTRAEFYSGTTKVCDINTNIPNGSGRQTGAGFMIMRGAATAGRTMDTDFTRLAVDMTSARSP